MEQNIIELLINYGIFGIIIAAFIEPLFMPFPMELIFIPISLTNPKNGVLYALALISSSALGTVISYFIGKRVGRTILNKIVSGSTIEKIEDLYNKNAFMTILTSVFTPIPYEAYTLSAGIFRINFAKFMIAAVLSRTIRYVPQGVLITLYGEAVLPVFKRYLIILGVIFIAAIIIIKIRKR